MILVDFSQLCHAGLWVFQPDIIAASKRGDDQEICNLLRHGILSQFRSIRMQFSDFGKEMVVCCDSRKGYWRTDIFEHYKANRKANKDTTLPWDVITPFFHSIRDDIRNYFPYKVVEIDKLEADDVIAILIEDVANKNVVEVGLETEPEPVLIYGGDKDGKQLHKYKNVRQYSPIQKKWVKIDEPARVVLKRLIITGDVGDGVPNIFSPNDTLVNKIRQKSATAKKVDKLLAAKDIFEACENDAQRQRLMENTRLISFDCIPKKYRPQVVEAYQAKPKGSKMKALEYFAKHGCKILMEDVDRF